MSIENVLYLIATLGGVYGLTYYKHIRKAYFWLSIFLLASAILQFVGWYIAVLFKTNELYQTLINPIYYLLVYFIFSNLSENYKTIRLINIVFILGSIPLLAYSVIAISDGRLAIEAISVSNFVFSIGCMVLFLDMIKEPVLLSPFRISKFYVLTAFLFYHSAILFFWIARSMYQGLILSNSIEYINLFMLFIYYTILFGALIVEKKYGLKDES